MNNEKLTTLETGIPGLDEILGGGLPEFSFNIIAGMPGTGKTTFCQQIMFNMANKGRRAIFFTALGEPPLKMLRYQQQFDFFDQGKVEDCIRYINLSNELMRSDFEAVLARITSEVREFAPSFVFVDSFRSIINHSNLNTESSIRLFIQQLAMHMTNWQATTFLVGEYDSVDTNPLFTIADSILWFTQNFDRNAMTRKLSVIKIRGQAQASGFHTYKLSKAGIYIFTRTVAKPTTDFGLQGSSPTQQRLSSGVTGLDEMLGGGIPSGYTVLVAGPSGVGKTILGTQFIAEGVVQGEHALFVSFEKDQNRMLNFKLGDSVRAGKVSLLDMKTLDLSPDELLDAMMRIMKQQQVKRVLLDSLSGLYMALAPEFRDNFKESLYRLTSALTIMGATVLMTTEHEDTLENSGLGEFGSSFLVDGIVLMRYMELGGELQRLLTVVKLSGSRHSRQLRQFEINDDGVVIGNVLSGYQGILTGQPLPR